MKNTGIIFIFFLLMTSCEYSYDYSYKVTNNTDAQISVYVKTFRIDSTFLIKKDSTKVLFTTNHGIEGSHGPYFEDVKVDLDEFAVTLNDTLKSSKNYLMNEAWTFTENPTHQGLYSTTVTPDEFKK